MVNFSFNPRAISGSSSDISFVNLLPTYLQTRENSKIFDVTFQQLFSKEQSSTLRGYIGEKPASYYNFATDYYISEISKDRTDYQLEPTLISEDASKNIYSSYFYKDLIDKLSSQGALVNNHSRLFSQEYYSFSPLMDLDKFVNFNEYYWVATGSANIDIRTSLTNNDIDVASNNFTITDHGYSSSQIVRFVVNTGIIPTGLTDNTEYKIVVVNQNTFYLTTLADVVVDITTEGSGTFYLEPRTSIFDDYIGTVSSNLPDGTPLQNGMRVIFYNDTVISNNTVPLLVEGVGESINFLDDSDFTTITDTTLNTPDFITIQRDSEDGNPWSKRNRWFHSSLLQNISPSAVITKARKPIIEFFRNLQLFNFGNHARLDVDAVYTLGDIQSLTGLANISIDNVILVDNMRVLVINDVDPERTNRIFKVYGIENSGVLSLSLEADGLSHDGDPVTNENIFVKTGAIHGNKYYNYDGTNWVLSQQKTSVNQFPDYNLYDETGIYLKDLVEYPESTFNGSTLFQYEIDTARTVDPILGLQISTDILGKPNFVNTIETESYTYISDFETTIIPGYYFAYDFKNNEYFNHWHISSNDSRQNIIDQFVIGEDTDVVDNIQVSATTTQNISGFIKGAGPEGIGDQFTGVNIQSGIFDGVTTLSIGDIVLIKDQDNGAQNGIYEYVSGTLSSAVFVRPLNYSSSSDLGFGTQVTPTSGSVYANVTFVMEQTRNLDWNIIPMIWVVLQNSGLKTSFELSQSPDPISDFEVGSISNYNITGFVAGGGYQGTNDSFGSVDLTTIFDLTQTYLVGDYFLVLNQSSGYQNGIYQYISGVPTSAVLKRATTAINNTQIYEGVKVFVTRGININTLYTMTQSTALDWSTVAMTWVKSLPQISNLSVTLNGQLLIINEDYKLIDGDVVYLSQTLELNKNDFLEVRSYSSDGPTESTYSGFYEIPINLANNANNDYVTTIGFSNVSTHFASIISNQPGFIGSAIGTNNFRDLTVDLGTGTNILEHSAPMLKLMTCNSLPSIDIGVSLDYVEKEYLRFYNKFVNTIIQLQTKGYTESTPLQTWVDDALSTINIGKNSTFPFAFNNIGNGTYYIPPSPAFLGVIPVYRPYKFVDYTATTPLRVLRLHDGQLMPAYDNPLSPSANLTQQINYISGTNTYILSYNTTVVFPWQLIVSTNGAPLIPTVDYTISTGQVNPEIIFTHDLLTNTPINIEWSSNILDDVILFLETMIYNSIDQTIRQSDSLDDSIVNYSPLQVTPGYFRDTGYSRAEWNNVSAIDFNNWIASNKIVDNTNTIYDSTDPFTWNYSNVTDPNGNYLPGHWRGIFRYFYDCERPNTQPWEMLGFSEKPNWWAGTYGPPPYTSENITLWTDIQNGTIVYGNRKGTYEYLKRPGILQLLPVDSSGNLLDPVTIGLTSSQIYYPAGSNIPEDYQKYINAPFVFGDLGPIEYAWRCSPSYPFGLAESMYLTKPAMFFEYFWDSKNFDRIFSDQTSGTQFVSTFNNLNKRIKNSDDVIYGEDDNYNLIGIQQIIVEYLVSQGKVASYLGDRIRGSLAYLAYRTSGFIDAASLSAVVDSFGIDPVTGLSKTMPDTSTIPSNNVRTALQKTAPLATVTYSGLLFTKQEGYISVTGYDFSNQYFNYYKPITSSTSTTVNYGGTQPNITEWASGIYYPVGTYVRNQNIVYLAVISNTASSNFNTDLTSGKWRTISVIPLVGGISVQKYTKYEKTPTILPYNTKFFSAQEAADFVYGYENYLETQGWAFETIQDDGTVTNFSYMFLQVLAWISSTSEEDVIIISPLAQSATFYPVFGYVDDLRNKVNGYPAVLDRLGFQIPTNKLSISRVNGKFVLSTVDSNTTQFIYCLKLSVVAVEHIIVFDNTTSFDDLVYSPLLGIRQNRIRLSVLRSDNWTGAFSAPGFIIDNNTVTTNLDKSTEDFKSYYNSDKKLTTSKYSLAAKKLYGFEESSYLNNVLYDERDQFQLYLGFLKEKGTPGALNKVLRSSYVTNPQNEVTFYEEWAVRIGRYGAYAADSEIEIELRQQDIKSNPQIIHFNASATNDANSVIELSPNDPRYLEQRFNNLTVNQFETKYITPLLPSAGYAMLTDAVLLVPTYEELNSYVQSYITDNGSFIDADRIWVAISKNTTSWAMYRIDTLALVSDITEGTLPTPSTIIVTAPISILEDSEFILQGCSDENIGVYVAKNITSTTFDVYDLSGNPVSLTAETFSSNYPQILRLHNCRFASDDGVITGSIQNPSIVTTVTLSINTVPVVLTSGDSLATVITSINTASIPNVTASNWFGKLRLTNTGGFSIALSPRVNIDLGIESTTPKTNWDNSKDLLFFDSFSANNNYWAITNINGTTVVRQQLPQIDINYVNYTSLIDQNTETKLLDLVRYNPAQNILPMKVVDEIDYVINKDPAYFNDGTNTTILRSDLAWGDDHVGRVWWDLSQVRYIDYEQGDSLYRKNNWGSTFPGTDIAIYEWVKSPVLPTDWASYISEGEGNGVYGVNSTPKYLDRYSTFSEYNPSLGEFIPMYYFWISDNNMVPSVSFRSDSIESMQEILQNPTSQGVVWFSPIDNETFIVANTEEFLTDNTILQIGFSDIGTNNVNHIHWSLVRQNDTIVVPPTDAWQKMRDSIVTFNKISAARADLIASGISETTFETYLTTGIIELSDDLVTPAIYTAYLPVPDPLLSDRQKYGNEFRPRQSWFKNPLAARKVFVQAANDRLALTNWVDISSNWDATISIEAQLFETPNFVVATLADRNALLTSISLFDGATIYVQSDSTLEGHWSFWQFQTSLAEKFVLLDQQTFNTTDYWTLVDWYAEGITEEDVTSSSNLIFATISARDSYPTFTENEIVYVSDNGSGRWAAYRYVGENDTTDWILVAIQNGTVQFNSNLYTDETQAASESLIYIINGFYNDLSSTRDKNQVFIEMIREAYVQNKVVDWAFKTSLVTSTGLEETLTEATIYKEDPVTNISEYLDDSKPYHSKFRGFIEKRNTIEEISEVNLEDTLTENHTMVFDAVSIYPDQQLMDSILSMPENTSALKAIKQQAIRDNFKAAERIAAFTNYNPSDVIPGAKFRGMDVDGLTYGGFSALFGINEGYSNSPYDNILGYDFRSADAINLYDAYINGENYTTSTSNIILDADKFLQPYLTDNRPDQLVVVKAADCFNMSVYTQGIFADSNNGYDVFPYDFELSGTGGYDYSLDTLQITNGGPKVESDVFFGDGSTDTYLISQSVQSEKAIQVYVNGVLKTVVTDYTLDWSLPTPQVIFNSPIALNDIVKIISYAIGGGRALKVKTYYSTSETIFDLGYTITISNGLLIIVDGVIAAFNTLVSGDTSLSSSQIKITSPLPSSSTVVITLFSGSDFAVVYNQTNTISTMPITLSDASTPIIPPFVNNLVYMDGLRLSPPYTRYFDIIQPGQTVFSINEPIYSASYVSVYVNGSKISLSGYTVDVDNNCVILNTGAPLGTTMISLVGNEDFDIADVGGIFNSLTVYTSSIATVNVDFVATGSSLTVDSQVISLTRPDATGVIPFDIGSVQNYTISGTIALNTVIAAGVSANLDINGTVIAVVITDSLTTIVDNINFYTNITNVTTSIATAGVGLGYLVLSNAIGHIGENILLLDSSVFGITTGAYLNITSIIRSQLGAGYYVEGRNNLLKITKLDGTTLLITDAIFGLPASTSNTGKKIDVISYKVNNSLDMRTEVYQGNTGGCYPITSSNYNDDEVLVSISGEEQTYLTSFGFEDSMTCYIQTGYLRSAIASNNLPSVVSGDSIIIDGITVSLIRPDNTGIIPIISGQSVDMSIIGTASLALSSAAGIVTTLVINGTSYPVLITDTLNDIITAINLNTLTTHIYASYNVYGPGYGLLVLGNTSLYTGSNIQISGSSVFGIPPGNYNNVVTLISDALGSGYTVDAPNNILTITRLDGNIMSIIDTIFGFQTTTSTNNNVITSVVTKTPQTEDKTIIITSFNSRKATPEIGYRYFKNVNDQWQYSRISDSNSTMLSTILRPYDTEIIVKDATILTQPLMANNYPGIVFIGSERILFRNVDTSTPGQHKLLNILRGTSGTPWGETFYPFDPITVTLASSIITLNDHGFLTGHKMTFATSGTLPTEISANVTYYAVVLSSDTFKIASSYNNAISVPASTLTLTPGSGILTIIVEPSPVRDAGMNQNIPVSVLEWEYTPNGLNLSNSSLAVFLNEAPGTNNYNG